VNNGYMNDYMKRRYQRRRAEAVAQLGGCCVQCGDTKDLELHHKDPTQKSFTLARGSSFSDERWQEEIGKCELLCKGCHVDHHRSKYPCGTPQRYWAGCKCDLCRQANRAYNREYKRKRALRRETAK